MGSKFQNSQGCNTVRPYLKERERKGRKEGRKNERKNFLMLRASQINSQNLRFNLKFGRICANIRGMLYLDTHN